MPLYKAWNITRRERMAVVASGRGKKRLTVGVEGVFDVSVFPLVKNLT